MEGVVEHIRVEVASWVEKLVGFDLWAVRGGFIVDGLQRGFIPNLAGILAVEAHSCWGLHGFQGLVCTMLRRPGRSATFAVPAETLEAE